MLDTIGFLLRELQQRARTFSRRVHLLGAMQQNKTRVTATNCQPAQKLDESTVDAHR
jgi:hypothetical protein